MKLDKVHLVFFSPTRTSRKIGEAIVRGTGLKCIEMSDLTGKPAIGQEFGADTLVVVACPVYGGHIPPLALSRMEGLHASGTPAVAVVVYGNRAYEHALQELDSLLAAKSFRVIAAGTFIGEHSYSTERHPIAAGRPDAKDLEEAALLGRRVMEKLRKAGGADMAGRVDVSRIRKPRQPFFHLLRFIYKVTRMRKSGQPMPSTPAVDADLCTHCGHCAAVCPNEAIAKGDECHTRADRCIRCCACVKGCPQKARSFDTPFAGLLSENFRYRKANQVIL